MRIITLTFFLLFISIDDALCQRVQWKAFRFTEENEFFNLTQHGIDRYYTQGLRLEVQYQVSKRGLLEKLVIPIRGADVNVYSSSLTQQIYTPARVDKYFFQGDYPYGGSLYLSEALESYDSARQRHLFSRLDVGLIGPAAMAEQTQWLFHKLIKGQQSVGWETQQRNDVYLNYHLKLQQGLIYRPRFFQLEGRTEVNFGLALINLVPGLNLGIGNWPDASTKFAWQLFFNPEVRFILFNAMIQGGVLNQANADELYSQFLIDQIKPLVYAHSTGLRLRYNRIEFLYRQVSLTREFTKQKPHYYSTLMFTFPFSQRPAK